MAQFNPDALPPQPNIVPDELRSLMVDNTGPEWTSKVPPQAVGMFITAVVRWLSDPRFGVKVSVDTEETGWTIRVDLPKPEIREDVLLAVEQ